MPFNESRLDVDNLSKLSASNEDTTKFANPTASSGFNPTSVNWGNIKQVNAQAPNIRPRSITPPKPERSFRDIVKDTADSFNNAMNYNSPKKMAEVEAMSHQLKLDPGYVLNNYDSLVRKVYGREPENTIDYIQKFTEAGVGVAGIGAIGLTALTMGPVTAAALAASGIGAFEAFNEAKSFLVQKAQGEHYKAFQHRQATELLPKDTSELTRDTLEFLEFGGELLATGAMLKGFEPTAPGQATLRKTLNLDQAIAQKYMRETKTYYDPPERVFFKGEDIKDIFQTGTKLSPEERTFVTEALDGDFTKYKAAINSGQDLSVTTTKLMRITQDKALWGKLKSIVNVRPYRTEAIEITREAKFGEAEPVTTVKKPGDIIGYLESPTYMEGRYAEEIGRTAQARSLEERVNQGAEERLRVWDVAKDGLETQPREIAPDKFEIMADVTRPAESPKVDYIAELISRAVEMDEELGVNSTGLGIEQTTPPPGLPEARYDELFDEATKNGFTLLPSKSEIKAASSQIKQRVEELSSQLKISAFYEKDAMNKAISEAVYNAKLGYRTGRKDGVMAERERIKGLKAEQIARSVLADRSKEIIGNIKKVKSDKRFMGTDARDLLDPFFESFDLVKLTEPKRAQLTELKNKIESDSSLLDQIPNSKLAELSRLDKTYIKDMTLAELETIHDAIMTVADEERARQSSILGGKIVEHDTLVSNILRDVGIADKGLAFDIGQVVDPLLDKADAENLGKQIVKKILEFNLAPDGWMAHTFGEKTAMYRTFIQEGINATNEKLRVRQSYDDEMYLRLNSFCERNQIDDIPRWLSEERVTGRLNFSRDRFISLFCHSRLKDNRNAILTGGFGFREDLPEPPKNEDEIRTVIKNVTEDELLKLVSSISSQELDFVNTILDPMFLRIGQEVGIKYEQRNLRKFDLIGNYYPKPTMEIKRKHEVETMTRRKVKFGLNDAFTLERVGSVAPLYLDGASLVISDHIEKTSKWLGMVDYSDACNRILSDEKFMLEIVNKYGKNIFDEIEKIVIDIVNGPEGSTFLPYEIKAKLQAYDKNISRAFVVSPLRILANFAAFPLYNQYVESTYLWDGLIELSSDSQGLMNFIESISPMFKERGRGGVNPEIEQLYKGWGYFDQLRNANIKSVRELIEKEGLGDALADPANRDKLISVMYVNADRKACAVGMTGAIKQCMDQFKSGNIGNQFQAYLDIIGQEGLPTDYAEQFKLAIGYAEHATRRTQNMSDAVSQTKFMREFGFAGRLFGKFSSQTSRMFNNLAIEMSNAKKSGDWSNVVKWLVLLYAFNGGVEEAVKYARSKIYDRKYNFNPMRMAADQTFSMMYFARDIYQSAQSKANQGTWAGRDITIPAFYAPDAAINAGVELWGAFTEKNQAKQEKHIARAADYAIRSYMVCKGFPVWPYNLYQAQTKE